MRNPRPQRMPARSAGALLLAVACLASSATAQPADSGTYPTEPYNGLQLNYVISGGRITSTEENDDWTRTLTFKGDLGSGRLGVSGVARRSGGWTPPTVSATLEVTVEVDGERQTAKAELLRDSTETFDVSLPIPPGATSGRIAVELVGIYNVGTRNVRLLGTFTRRGPAPNGSGRVESPPPPPPEVQRPRRRVPPVDPEPPSATGGLMGTITGCRRDPLGRAIGPDEPLAGALVIAGRDLAFESGYTGEDTVKNARGVVAQGTTDARGLFALAVPAGIYEVIVWRRHYVPQVDSGIVAPAIHDRSICDNITAPVTHERLVFASSPAGSGEGGGVAPAESTEAPLPPNVVRDAEGMLQPASGYRWLNEDPEDHRVQWTPGTPHATALHVETSDNEGQWSPAPGYAWLNEQNGDLRVVWKPGRPHPIHPHVVAAPQEGQWVAAPGFRWASEAPGDFRVLSESTGGAPGAEPPPPAGAGTGSQPGGDPVAAVLGEWIFRGNDYRGTLTFERSGGQIVGRLFYDAVGRPERLVDVRFDSRTGEISFTRPWEGNPSFQKYGGVLDNGSITGTFSDSNSPGQRYPWWARRR